MIEEPENGLTPQAIKAFYQALRGLVFHAAPEQRSQILVSSHSPFLICEAWNGDDGELIHQVKVTAGRARTRRFSSVIEELGIQLGKNKNTTGNRMHLSLNNAGDIMSGRMS
jgi:predicted ATPase